VGCGKKEEKPNIVHKIYDDAQLFSSEQTEAIQTKVQSLFSEQSIVIVTVETIDSPRPFHLPEKRLRTFTKETDAENAILILISLAPHLLHVEFDNHLWVEKSYSVFYPSIRESVYPEVEAKNYQRAIDGVIQYLKRTQITTREEYIESHRVLNWLNQMAGEYLSDSYAFLADWIKRLFVLPNFGVYYLLFFEPFTNFSFFFFRIFGASIWAIIISLGLFLLNYSLLKVMNIKLGNRKVDDFRTAHLIAQNHTFSGCLAIFYIFFILIVFGFGVYGLFSVLMRFQTADQIALSGWLYPGIKEIQPFLFEKFPIEGRFFGKSLSDPGGWLFALAYVVPSLIIAIKSLLEEEERKAANPEPVQQQDEEKNVFVEAFEEAGREEWDREGLMFGFIFLRTLLVGWFFPLAFSVCLIVEIFYRLFQVYVETFFLLIIAKFVKLKPIIYRFWMVSFFFIISVFIFGFRLSWQIPLFILIFLIWIFPIVRQSSIKANVN
jgi:hypothetical protein